MNVICSERGVTRCYEARTLENLEDAQHFADKGS
jgi:hypothetical protein